MIKNKVLSLVREFIDEWLLGFSDKDFQLKLFSSDKLHLSNAIVNANRVNQMLYEYNVPYRLKAGIIGKLNIKSSMWNLFSESFVLELQDIHFIFGPNWDHLSTNDHFHRDP